MSLQFIHDHSVVCRVTLPNLRAHCATVALSCFNNNMATNLKFASSYDSNRVFPHVTVDLRHLWQVMQRNSDDC